MLSGGQSMNCCAFTRTLLLVNQHLPLLQTINNVLAVMQNWPDEQIWCVLPTGSAIGCRIALAGRRSLVDGNDVDDTDNQADLVPNSYNRHQPR